MPSLIYLTNVFWTENRPGDDDAAVRLLDRQAELFALHGLGDTHPVDVVVVVSENMAARSL